MHKQNFSTKAMVEAGLISTMMVAMFLLTVNLPMFSGLSLFIYPSRWPFYVSGTTTRPQPVRFLLVRC